MENNDIEKMIKENPLYIQNKRAANNAFNPCGHLDNGLIIGIAKDGEPVFALPVKMVFGKGQKEFKKLDFDQIWFMLDQLLAEHWGLA